MSDKKISKQFRIIDRKKGARIELTLEQAESFKKMCDDLVLSEDELAKALLMFGFELLEYEDDSELENCAAPEVGVGLVEANAEFENGQDSRDEIIYQDSEEVWTDTVFFGDLESINNDFKMDDMVDQITINLQLTSYTKEQDPIEVILPRLSELLKMPMQTIVKQLYFYFLNENDILNMDNSHKILSVDTNLIIHRLYLEPYKWSGNVFADWDSVKKGLNSYAFLKKGIHKRTNKLTIQFNGPDDVWIMKTLRLVTKRLHRNETSFFKMLLMYWFRSANLVDQNFKLMPNIDVRLQSIAKTFKDL